MNSKMDLKNKKQKKIKKNRTVHLYKQKILGCKILQKNIYFYVHIDLGIFY